MIPVARWLRCLAAPLLMLMLAAPAAAQVDPSIIPNLNWDQMQWFKDTVNPGSWYTIISGDPAGSGPYVIINKVEKGNFNRPHSHPRERKIYVIKGTWWVGTGNVVDPARSQPMGPGETIPHYANAVHWDGAKDEDVLLMIGGQGPAVANFVN